MWEMLAGSCLEFLQFKHQGSESWFKRQVKVDELLCACFNYPMILRFLCIDLNSSNKALSSPHSLLSIRALFIRYASKERNYSSSRLAWRKGEKKYKWAGMISSAIQYVKSKLFI